MGEFLGPEPHDFNENCDRRQSSPAPPLKYCFTHKICIIEFYLKEIVSEEPADAEFKKVAGSPKTSST
jgi:hypothetical protein